MSNAFSVSPDVLATAGGEIPAVPLATRALRSVRLLRSLTSQWTAAANQVPRLTCRERQLLVQAQAQRLLAGLGIRVVVRGDAPLLGEPALLAANHVSWLDPYVINTVCAARFLAKSEIATWPVVGTIARRHGTFFHRRGSFRCAARVKDRIARTLRGGEPVAFFPEGTTTSGASLARFYPAFFQAAVDSGATVRPVAIRYRDAAGRTSGAAAYVGKMSILDSVRSLLAEPSLTVEMTFGAPLDPAAADRRELARRVRAWIAGQLFPKADSSGGAGHAYID